MAWSVVMKGEGEARQRLFDEGDYLAVIKDVENVSAEESKSGNPYFRWTLEIDGDELKMVTTLKKGKRWLLKQLLSACGIEAKPDDPDEKYTFGKIDVIGKEVMVQIKNKKQSFTGRDGDIVEFERSEVVRVRPIESLKNSENDENVSF